MPQDTLTENKEVSSAASIPLDIATSSGWTGGVNSLINPLFLPDNQVQFSFNTINRGGIYQTRPGYSVIKDNNGRTGEPRGLTLFKPIGSPVIMVKAVGQKIRFAPAPFKDWQEMPGITLDKSNSFVHFATAIKGVVTNEDGSRTVLPPKPMLVIQSGHGRAYTWDGSKVESQNPFLKQIPIGTWMQWVGSRLWVASGNQLFASNLLEPDKFIDDGSNVAGAGSLVFNEEITGLGVTADQNALLVFTDTSTSSVQAGVLDRSQWGMIDDFQRVILPSIGCIAGRTIINQYGLIWWMSQGGLIGLDSALIAFRSSRIKYSDQEMARSKSNISFDVSRSCAGANENFLTLSVPSGSYDNAHTWVMDQGVMDSMAGQAPAAWSSCWTGTNPVQWVTGTIDGQNRCFFLSRGTFPDQLDNAPVSDVWEAFTDLRKDIGLNANNVKMVSNIQCSIETKFLQGRSSAQKTFLYMELMMIELSRFINLKASYASRHSGYKKVLDKNIISTVDTFDGKRMSTMHTRLRQSRRIRTSSDVGALSDNDPPIEDIWIRNKGKGFYALIEWTGEAAIEGLMLVSDVRDDQPTGRVESNETTQRYITPDGAGEILPDAIVLPSFDVSPTTSSILSISPRYIDSTYNSLQ